MFSSFSTRDNACSNVWSNAWFTVVKLERRPLPALARTAPALEVVHMLALSRYCHATGGRELNISILSLLSCASFATPFFGDRETIGVFFFWRGLDLLAAGGAAIVLLERVERNGDAGGFPLIPQYSPGVKLGGGRRCRCGGRPGRP